MASRQWRDAVIGTGTTLMQSMAQLDATAMQILLVVDQDSKLLGTMTDGDSRRAFLRGASLDHSVLSHINTRPAVVRPGTSHLDALDVMRRLALRALPVVAADGRVVGLITLDDLLDVRERDNPVLIMAGGRGKRLAPLTDDLPKPLVPVAGRALIDILIERLFEQGLSNLFISIHYLAHVVEAHVRDSLGPHSHLHFVRESNPLGTAGALGLLPSKPDMPLLVVNCDLLTSADYGEVLDSHQSSGADATVVVNEEARRLPYGVVSEVGGWVTRIEEKPVRTELVIAGVYVFSPDSLGLVPPQTRMDMPDLLNLLLAERKRVATHRHSGYWLDVGTGAALEQARRDHLQT